MKTLKIATRKSPLALWQAAHVKKQLLRVHSDLSVELVSIQTEGDRFLDTPLVTVGGKGLFIKELEQALLENRADIAVHSMKDVTLDLSDEFALPVIIEREDNRDVFISNTYKKIEDVSEDAVLGTSSLRRQSQVKALHPNIALKNLRGNVGTRLSKLDVGKYDAIILAAAGMIRLGLTERVTQFIPSSILLPAIGQGAIGIECRANDDAVHELIAPLNHRETSLCIQAERAFSRRLFGGCQLPIAGQASIAGDEVELTGLIARVDGSEVIQSTQKGSIADIESIGVNLAEILLQRGGSEILNELIH